MPCKHEKYIENIGYLCLKNPIKNEDKLNISLEHCIPIIDAPIIKGKRTDCYEELQIEEYH